MFFFPILRSLFRLYLLPGINLRYEVNFCLLQFSTGKNEFCMPELKSVVLGRPPAFQLYDKKHFLV